MISLIVVFAGTPVPQVRDGGNVYGDRGSSLLPPGPQQVPGTDETSEPVFRINFFVADPYSLIRHSEFVSECRPFPDHTLELPVLLVKKRAQKGNNDVGNI
jgi:hypothetical protein